MQEAHADTRRTASEQVGESRRWAVDGLGWFGLVWGGVGWPRAACVRARACVGVHTEEISRWRTRRPCMYCTASQSCESHVVTKSVGKGPRSSWNLIVSSSVPPAAYL
jgi:hypothetical protein